MRMLVHDQDGLTALALAARQGSEACVTALLAVGGIDVNAQDKVRVCECAQVTVVL